MIVKTTPNFDKSFKKRILPNSKLTSRFKERLSLFTENPSNPTLKDHSLIGSLVGYRAFAVNGDIRVVYRPLTKNLVILYDIGSHNQVY